MTVAERVEASTGTTVGAEEEARAAVERLYALERELSRKRLEMDGALAEAEEAAGESVLDVALAGSGSSARALSRVEGVRVEMRATDRAITAARRRRLDAIPLVWRAQAQPLLARAAELRAEADAREPRTRELLDALREWEDCEYAPAPPKRPLPTQYQDPPTPPLVGYINPPGIPRAEARNPVGDLRIVYIPTPRTQLLRNEAADLTRRAEDLLARTVGVDGRILAASREELLVELEARGPMALAPALPAVLAWLGPQEERERERRRRELARSREPEAVAPVDAAVSMTLSWRGGEIDATRSQVGGVD